MSAELLEALKYVRRMMNPDSDFAFVDAAIAAWNTRAAQPSQWQPIARAPEGETVLVYMASIDAIDLAHRMENGRWVSGGGTVWPDGVCTLWHPLPSAPDSAEACWLGKWAMPVHPKKCQNALAEDGDSYPYVCQVCGLWQCRREA